MKSKLYHMKLNNFNGVEKGFCCIHSNALDFAKVGRVFNDGQQIVSSSYIEKIKNPIVSDFYSYGWWITTIKGFDVFYMRGFLGQYVAVVPDKNIIVVRLGKKEEKIQAGNFSPPDSFVFFMNEVLTKY